MCVLVLSEDQEQLGGEQFNIEENAIEITLGV